MLLPHAPLQVQQMGQYFGIKPDEDKYIWEVAEMGLCAPLPPGWQEQVVVEQQDEAAEAAAQAPTIAFRFAAAANDRQAVCRRP
jgi:hypothetical protein